MNDDWQKSDGRNVYQMVLDAKSPDIWIRRTTWDRTCARVVGIGRVEGKAPYFGNPSILMDVYSLGGELKDELTPVNVPGTYKTWRQISPPAWSNVLTLRSLDDPTIDAALASQDKKRGKAAREDRIELKVPFARKEEAKKIGAKWDARRKKWWIRAQNNEDAKSKATKLGFI